MEEAIKELEYAIVRERGKLKFLTNTIRVYSQSQLDEKDQKIEQCEKNIVSFELAIKHLYNISQS